MPNSEFKNAYRQSSNSLSPEPVIARLLLKGDRSSCDGTFFLKVNRYKLAMRDNAQKPSWQFDSFRKYVENATVFVKHEG